MRLPWRRRVEPVIVPEVDTEATEALARQHALAPEVGRVARALHRLLEDNHLSPRIAALYTRDD